MALGKYMRILIVLRNEEAMNGKWICSAEQTVNLAVLVSY
jgi:hypothetical protein